MSESEYYGTGCQPSSGFFPIPKCKTVTPPMLSDKEMQEWRHNHRAQYKAGDGPTYTEGIEDARYFYEAKRAAGELVVVDVDAQEKCDHAFSSASELFRFCPFCGKHNDFP